MNTTLRMFALRFSLVTMVLLLCGCVPGESTRKAQPRYNEICDKIAPDQTQLINTLRVRDAGRNPVDPARYKNGSVEHDIAQARGYLNNVRKDYERFDCQQEHKNRHYDYPLLATALIASGAALAKANAYVLGGIGLTAGGIVAAKAYKHPDADRDAYLEAYRELTCVYDATHILKYHINIDTLKVDRIALGQAMATVNADIGKHSGDGKQTTTDKAAIQAANAAIDAGNKALTQIGTAISDYKKMPGAIYSTVDKIDYAARKASTTEGSYGSFNTSIKDSFTAAGENKANLDDFKKSVAAAKGAAATADTATTTAAGTSKTQQTLFGPPTIVTTLNITVANPCAPAMHVKNTDANATPEANKTTDTTEDVDQSFVCDSITTANGKATDSNSGAELPASSTLRDNGTSDVAKLIGLTEITASDLPAPSYSEVLADVSLCLPKQQ